MLHGLVGELNKIINQKLQKSVWHVFNHPINNLIIIQWTLRLTFAQKLAGRNHPSFPYPFLSAFSITPFLGH
jgi:hypothetical protein